MSRIDPTRTNWHRYLWLSLRHCERAWLRSSGTIAETYARSIAHYRRLLQLPEWKP